MKISYLAPGDVARRLGLSVSRITQLSREGKLLAERDSSGRRLFDPAVVERFARERDQRRAAAPSPEAA